MWKLLLGGIAGFIVSLLMSPRSQQAPSLTDREPLTGMPEGPIRLASTSESPEPSTSPGADDAPVSKAHLEEARSAIDKRVQNATRKRRRRKPSAA